MSPDNPSCFFPREGRVATYDQQHACFFFRRLPSNMHASQHHHPDAGARGRPRRSDWSLRFRRPTPPVGCTRGFSLDRGHFIMVHWGGQTSTPLFNQLAPGTIHFDKLQCRAGCPTLFFSFTGFLGLWRLSQQRSVR